MKKIFASITIINLSLCLFLLFVPKKAAALESYTSYVTQDAWVYSLWPNNNYGGAVNLFELYNTTGPKEGRTFFKIDLSGIPSNATVTMATFFIYTLGDAQSCYGNPTGNFYLSQVAEDWNENTITWNNQPQSHANALNPISCTTGYGVGLDFKYIAQGMISGELDNYGLAIYGINNTTNWERTIRSRETGVSSTAKIFIQYTLPSPEEPPANSNTNSGSSPNTPSSNTNNPTTSPPPSQSGISTGSNSAPAATTSSSIKAPTELTANDSGGEGPAIRLDWQKSATANISGYKIFRSENEKDGFINIANADKDTLTFTDLLIESDKTYYYFVRAYKDKLESDSSNTVSLSSALKIIDEVVADDNPLDETAVKKFNWKSLDDWKKLNWPLIGLSAVAVILIGFLVIYEVMLKKRKILSNITTKEATNAGKQGS